VGVVLALLLCACRSPESANAGELPSPYALTCITLVPTEVRNALPDFTVHQERPCPGCGPLCIFRSKEQPDVTISLAYDCRPRDADLDMHALVGPTLQAGGVEVPALGRAAARREPVPGMMQVVAWDDDTPCSLIVTWLGEGRERAQDLARMALAALTHERLARSAAALEMPARLEDESTRGSRAPEAPRE
jgi:hypothetical protein